MARKKGRTSRFRTLRVAEKGVRREDAAHKELQRHLERGGKKKGGEGEAPTGNPVAIALQQRDQEKKKGKSGQGPGTAPFEGKEKKEKRGKGVGAITASSGSGSWSGFAFSFVWDRRGKRGKRGRRRRAGVHRVPSSAGLIFSHPAALPGGEKKRKREGKRRSNERSPVSA